MQLITCISWLLWLSHVNASCLACAEVTGITQHVPELLGSRSMCWGCWVHAVCARVAGVAQCVLGSLGSYSMCQGHWEHSGSHSMYWGRSAYATVTGIMQYVLMALGSFSLCQALQSCCDYAVCGRVAWVAQRVLERDISAKLVTEVCQSWGLKYWGLTAKLANGETRIPWSLWPPCIMLFGKGCATMQCHLIQGKLTTLCSIFLSLLTSDNFYHQNFKTFFHFWVGWVCQMVWSLQQKAVL